MDMVSWKTEEDLEVMCRRKHERDELHGYVIVSGRDL